jgi:hypothetical protein
MEVGDHIDRVEGGRTGDVVNHRKLRVRLFVLAYVVKRRRIIGNRWYVLEYTKVERIDLNYPGELKLFPAGFDTNFGDWGYDELTSPKQSLFRHEILFSSGATVTIDFRNCSVRRKPARNAVRMRES